MRTLKWFITIMVVAIPIIASNSTCINLHLIPTIDQCSYVTQNCDDHKLGYLNYFKLYYCHSIFFKVVTIAFTLLLLIISFISLGLTSSEFLCPNLSTISFVSQIPDNLSGLTLLAFGNGSPDIMGTYTSFMSNNGSLAIGELIGSAFLITSLVIGLMSIVHPFKIYNDETHEQDKLIFIRDAFFFIVSVLLVIVFLFDGKLQMWECMVMITLYLAYVALIICWNWILKLSRDQILLDQRIRNVYNFDEQLVIDNVEEDEDKLENFNTLMRPSLFDALEFQSVVTDLQKKQSLPTNGLSVISDQHQMDLIRESLNNRPNTTNFTEYVDDQEEEEGQERRLIQSSPLDIDYTEYELRNSNESVEIPMTLKQLLNKRQHLRLEKDELIQLFPLLKDFNSNNFTKKIFLIICLPIYLLLKLTIPVRQKDDFNDDAQIPKFELKMLLIQSSLSSLIIGLSTYGESSSLFLTMLISIVAAIILPSTVHTILGKSNNPNLKKLAHLTLSLIGFITSISWISIIATELVSILKFLANLLNLSDLILGLTLFAMGNSLGDFISNFTIAKMGFPLMALLACFGGPLLNLLLGIGLNGVVVLRRRDLEFFEIEIDSTLIISSIFLLANLCFLIVAVPFNNWRVDRWIGLTMISFWCVGTLINIVIASV